jgi:hypothetical protein
MSTVKVNTVDKRTGGTLTLGGCGTTVTLGAGATQSGFGRTGTVDWCTTAKTAPFTGVSGNGYFVNTTSGVVTVTLPASPSAGDIISIADYASTFQTNNVTLCNNSSKINGVCATAGLSTQGQSVTLVYVDATRGWKNTMDSTSNVTATPNYIIATGGTITCCGDYKIHTFTSDGCFAVTNAGTPAGSVTVDYLVVAGGGAGGVNIGGGGGAGGFRESSGAASGCYSKSPLGACVSALPVSVQAYPVTVGGGGTATPLPSTAVGGSGSNSVFSTITSAGGGGGGNPQGASATAGGSGGGGRSCDPASATPITGGAGNTPPVSPPQGNTGGSGIAGARPGGGGGATTTGTNGSGAPFPVQGCSGDGGTGATTSISTSPTAYAGGGGGGGFTCYSTAGTGGTGGGGNGGQGPASSAGSNGTANTGGGSGGGGSAGGVAGTGGSGIVIVRYKFQN